VWIFLSQNIDIELSDIDIDFTLTIVYMREFFSEFLLIKRLEPEPEILKDCIYDDILRLIESDKGITFVVLQFPLFEVWRECIEFLYILKPTEATCKDIIPICSPVSSDFSPDSSLHIVPKCQRDRRFSFCKLEIFEYFTRSRVSVVTDKLSL
jgi:hypothetical protein